MADIGRLLASFAGGALEGGVNAFDYNKQQEEKKRQQAIQDAQRLQQDLLFKQGQEDRTRQHAATAYQTLQQQGQQALTQGNYGQAQQLMPKMYENLNAATGLDLVGPKLAAPIVGGGVEQARPSSTFMGPMTEKQVANPKYQAGLNAVFGYTPRAPKVEVKPLGNGGYLKVTTHPDGTVATEEKTGTPKTGTLKQDPVTGEWFTPTAGATTHVKPAKASAGHAAKPVNWQTKTVVEGGKRVIYAFNPQTREWVATGKEAPAPAPKASGFPLLDDTPAPVAPVAPASAAPKPKPKPSTKPSAKAVRDKFGF